MNNKNKNMKKTNKSYSLHKDTIERLGTFKGLSTYDFAISYLLDFYYKAKASAKGVQKAELFIMDNLMCSSNLKISNGIVRSLTGCRAEAVNEAMKTYKKEIEEHNARIEQEEKDKK